MNDFIIYALSVVAFGLVFYGFKKIFGNSEPAYLLEFGSRSEAVKHLILLQNVRIKGCDEQTRVHIKRQEAKLKQMLEAK